MEGWGKEELWIEGAVELFCSLNKDLNQSYSELSLVSVRKAESSYFIFGHLLQAAAERR